MRPQNFAMRRHPSFNRFLLLLGVVICLLAGWLLRQENYPGRYYLLSSAEIAQQPLPWVRVTRQGEQAFAEIYDRQPWAYVRLEVNGKPATALGYNTLEADRLYHWRWQLTADTLATPSQLSFFHTCQLGCQAWAVQHIGMPPITEPRPYRPTQLGAVFASPQRNWHGRQAWSVEMTYAQLPDDETWGVDALAERVRLLHSNGLQVLVRVEFARGQSLPPEGDWVALSEYLTYLRRLNQDVRLKGVYAWILGSSYNTSGANQMSGKPASPQWVARLVNGAGVSADRDESAVGVVRTNNPQGRVLLGAVAPWRDEANGSVPFSIHTPSLNYFYTLLLALADATQSAGQVGGWSLLPDGFAVQAPGTPSLSPAHPALEPQTDLRDPHTQAQMGFRVYQDWQAVINAVPATQGLPIYITATNTFEFATDQPPAQNYPPGWLTHALAEIAHNPQIHALCWFMDDLAGDAQWQFFSLTQGQGQLQFANTEFDALLGGE